MLPVQPTAGVRLPYTECARKKPQALHHPTAISGIPTTTRQGKTPFCLGRSLSREVCRVTMELGNSSLGSPAHPLLQLHNTVCTYVVMGSENACQVDKQECEWWWPNNALLNSPPNSGKVALAHRPNKTVAQALHWRGW